MKKKAKTAASIRLVANAEPSNSFDFFVLNLGNCQMRLTGATPKVGDTLTLQDGSEFSVTVSEAEFGRACGLITKVGNSKLNELPAWFVIREARRRAQSSMVTSAS